MSDLLYSVGVDPTELNTGVAAVEARLAESGINMAEAPRKYAKASADAFTEVYAAEDRLAAFRAKTAFDRMSDEEKLAVLRMEGLGLMEQVEMAEYDTAKQSGLRLELEKKKSQIYDLNNKIVAAQTPELAAQTGIHREHTGLLGAVEDWSKKIKKGFHDMGISLHGAGIGIALAAIVSLAKEAVEEARKQRDEYEKLNKPITLATRSMAALGDAAADVKKAAAVSVGFFLSGYTQLGELLGSTINRLRGINEAQEVYAEQTGRAAKAAEDRLKKLQLEQHDTEKIASARKDLEEGRRKAAMDAATEEQKFSLLAMQNVRLREQLRNTEAGTVLYYERQNQLLQNGVELNKQGVLLAKQRAEQELRQVKNDDALAITYQEKAVVLAKERNVLLQEFSQLQKGTNDYKEVENKLDENGVALLKLQRTWRKETGLDRAAQIELAKLELKAMFDITGVARALSDTDRARLDLLRLQKKEKENQYQIDELIEKRLVAKLTPAEQDRLKELFKQEKSIEKQIALKERLIQAAADNKKAEDTVITSVERLAQLSHEDLLAQADLVEARLAKARAEGAVTAELEKQLAIIQKILDKKKKAETVFALGLRDLGSISSDVLAARMKQLQKQIDEYALANPTRNASADNFFTASQIGSIEQELAFRRSFTGAYARGGREGALANYASEGRDVTYFDTAIANMSAWSKGTDALQQSVQKTNRQLAAISAQLGGSKLFPSPITIEG